jgi:hypothetical protein
MHSSSFNSGRQLSFAIEAKLGACGWPLSMAVAAPVDGLLTPSAATQNQEATNLIMCVVDPDCGNVFAA